MTTKATEPFVIKKKLNVDKAAYERMSFEEKYEGFVVDYIRCVENDKLFRYLLQDVWAFFRALAEEVKFKYKFHIVGDGNYGGKNPVTGEGNGMIRELLDQYVDPSSFFYL